MNKITENRMNRKQNEFETTEQKIDYRYETTDKITNNEPATNDDVKLDAVAHEQG
jgi:hypothetical protein